MKFIRIVTIISFSILLGKAFNLQIIHGRQFLTKSSQNLLKKRAIVAERGLIKDRHGVVLAQSRPRYRLVAKIYSQLTLEDFSKQILWLSEQLGVSVESLEAGYSKALNSGVGDFVLAANLSREKALLVENFLSTDPFFQVEVDPVRSYPMGEAYSHLLGYVGQVSEEEFRNGRFDNYLLGEVTGKDGLERQFEETLRGVNGLEIVEIDAKGDGIRVLSRQKPERGRGLTLTVDGRLQDYAFNILKNEGLIGSIIVSHVKDGNILAAVNYPSYDNNVFIEGRSEDINALFEDPSKPLFNRFLSGQYPPGSIFKLVMAAAALKEGVVSKDTLIEAPGSISYGDFTYKDWRPSGHGVLNIVGALAKSADTFFYKIGGGYDDLSGLGVDRIYRWAKSFNLGKRTGIDLPGEAEGLVPNKAWKQDFRGEPWYIGNTYHLSIGQGDLLATPLQVNLFTNIVASRGQLFKPNLIKDQSELKGFLDIGSDIFDVIREGMVKACSPGGTAFPLFEYANKIACKTGTSETGAGSDTHAWLTMFFPPQDPQYSVTVFLENGGGGSEDAAPVAKEIYQYMVSDDFQP